MPSPGLDPSRSPALALSTPADQNSGGNQGRHHLATGTGQARGPAAPPGVRTKTRPVRQSDDDMPVSSPDEISGRMDVGPAPPTARDAGSDTPQGDLIRISAAGSGPAGTASAWQRPRRPVADRAKPGRLGFPNGLSNGLHCSARTLARSCSMRSPATTGLLPMTRRWRSLAKCRTPLPPATGRGCGAGPGPLAAPDG